VRDAKGHFVKGHKVPDEWKENLSKQFKEKPNSGTFKKGHAVPQAWRNEYSRLRTGKKQTKETCDRRAISLKKAYDTGKRPRPFGELSGRWKGGKTKQGDYWNVKCYGHPRADYQGYVNQATIILEKKLGRYLVKGEVVHHMNGIPDDDRPENLMVMTNHEHVEHHAKLRRGKPRGWSCCSPST